MANEQKKYEYVLPVGTVLISKNGSDGKEQRYTIEQVVNGKPLPPGQKVKSSDTVAPVLGQGGFGITYLASSTIMFGNIPHPMHFAIKEFFVKGSCYRKEGSTQMEYSPASEQDVRESMKDFKDEANRLKEICKGNLNIVNVNEVFEANGTAYYVMEYLQGESLRDLVKRMGPLSEGVALQYIRPIAEAVRYIHTQHRLLHLDIKPDNIMLRKSIDGQQSDPVLIDFGISIHFNKKGDLTTTHASIGCSDGYAPQEQYSGIGSILEDRRRTHQDGFSNTALIPCEMDVYALGATLYYMLVGTNPYRAFSMTTDIVKSKLPQSISQKTRQAVIDAMQPAYRNRTQTAEEFLKGFEDRYTLPKGYVLHSPHANYLITEVRIEQDCYIPYGAILYTGNAQQQSSSSGSTTKAQRYIVYERFNRRMYQRKKDESVSPTGDIEKEKEAFLAICKKHTGLSTFDESETDGITIVRELFHANGTDYAVVKQGWRPQSGITETIRKIIKQLKAHARPLSIAACIALTVYGAYHAVGSCSEQQELERAKNKQLSAMLTDAIMKNDKAALEEFANADSARAYLPMANIYMEENDTAQARKYASLAINIGDESGKEIINRIEAKKEKPITHEKVEQKVKTEEPAKETKPANENTVETNKKQDTNTDNKKDKAEQLKNQQAEAAQKALQYLHGERTAENHKKAYQWALKADPETKAQVIKELQDLGFPIP